MVGHQEAQGEQEEANKGLEDQEPNMGLEEVEEIQGQEVQVVVEWEVQVGQE